MKVSQDVPKYMMVSGERAELRGLNLEGLSRCGFEVTEVGGKVQLLFWWIYSLVPSYYWCRMEKFSSKKICFVNVVFHCLKLHIMIFWILLEVFGYQHSMLVEFQKTIQSFIYFCFYFYLHFLSSTCVELSKHITFLWFNMFGISHKANIYRSNGIIMVCISPKCILWSLHSKTRKFYWVNV